MPREADKEKLIQETAIYMQTRAREKITELEYKSDSLFSILLGVLIGITVNFFVSAFVKLFAIDATYILGISAVILIGLIALLWNSSKNIKAAIKTLTPMTNSEMSVKIAEEIVDEQDSEKKAVKDEKPQKQ